MANHQQTAREEGLEQPRKGTYPLYHSSRRKPRRWPLALRFVKGAVHGDIFLPVLLHTIFAAIVVTIDQKHPDVTLRLPSTLIPSLSIVVGLMLVFRNSTSYDRWWNGQKELSTICSCVRNLVRSFLLACDATHEGTSTSKLEREQTEAAVRLLLALTYTVKSHLRAEWGLAVTEVRRDHNVLSRFTSRRSSSPAEANYDDLLLPGTSLDEDDGLSKPIQLSVQLESYIHHAVKQGLFTPQQGSQLIAQLNVAMNAFGNMETIRLTPIPVAYLIHIRQVLGLYGCVLPFAMVAETRWWGVLLTTLITFTLYGIEGIGQQLEDPFGYDKNDIKMDATVEDLRIEVMALLGQWKSGGAVFRGF